MAEAIDKATDRLRVLLDSSTPIVVMETVEESRAVRLVRLACQSLNLSCFEWTIASGLVRSGMVGSGIAAGASGGDFGVEHGPALGVHNQDAHAAQVQGNMIFDTRDPAKPKAWLNEAGVQKLAYYADPSAKVFQDLKMIGKAIGMPTTLLIDPNGCEIASLSGPAEWASDDGVKLVSAVLGRQ